MPSSMVYYSMQKINFTKEKLHKFKVAWNWAICTGNEQFEFEGNDYLVAYATYLIQYLETRLGTKPIKNEHAN
jgi:hypothetical protein